jgi:CRISPR-associated endonuclease Csy4
MLKEYGFKGEKMDSYIDVKIKPDAEMRANVLLNKVYSKFHKALCSLGTSNIGVSFPQYRVLLGNVIRIHATPQRLLALQNLNWLGGLIGYCELTSIQAVPNHVRYRVISRKQANMSEAKLRRLIKRGSICSEDIKKYRVKMFSQGFNNAYFELKSQSNQHQHRRYIQFGTLCKERKIGKFDSFGLSKDATIPWF